MFRNLSLMGCVVSVCAGIAGCVASGPGDQDPASASPGPAAGVVMPDAVKSIPVRPELARGVTTGDALPAKPAHRLDTQLAPGNFTWVVTTTATPTALWPNEYATITVTANHDVGPTPYYLRIWYWNQYGQVHVATCGTGTTCSGSVTRPDAGTLEFWGAVADGNGVLQDDDMVSVLWHGAGTALSTSSPTTGIGTSVILTATTDQDIGPTPFFVDIFDTTTGTSLVECGFGTSCSVEVSQAEATLHAYQAYLSYFPTSFPPPGIPTEAVANSATVTSTWVGH